MFEHRVFFNFLVNLPTNFRIPYKTRTTFLPWHSCHVFPPLPVLYDETIIRHALFFPSAPDKSHRIEGNTVFLLFENSNLKSRAIKIRRDESSARQKSFRAGEIGGRYSVAT